MMTIRPSNHTEIQCTVQSSKQSGLSRSGISSPVRNYDQDQDIHPPSTRCRPRHNTDIRHTVSAPGSDYVSVEAVEDIPEDTLLGYSQVPFHLAYRVSDEQTTQGRILVS